jgi:GNAT superfamily N-acetyltransferase
MTRKTVPLDLEHLDALPDAERGCLSWQLGTVEREQLDAEERAAEKRRWAATVMSEWGPCGRVAIVEDRVAGCALYAPTAWFPGAQALPTSPASPDAVLLASVWVDPACRRAGIGRLLVQGVARDMVERGHGALEAYGDTRGATVGCVVPAEFLGAVGFAPQRPHPTTPRMRMDLRSTISWKGEVEQALDRLWGVVRPVRAKAARPIGSVRTASGDQVVRRAGPARLR